MNSESREREAFAAGMRKAAAIAVQYGTAGRTIADTEKAILSAIPALSTETQPEGVLGLAEYEALKKAAELLSVAVELEKARLDLSEIPDDEINNRPQAKMQLRKHASNWFGNALKLLEDIDAARTGKPNARV